MTPQQLPSHRVLRDGWKIPTVGFGTFRLMGNEAFQAVSTALRNGFLHIDTASIYKNHEEIGRAIRESAVPRDHVFVTSKLSPYEQGSQKAMEALAQMISCLGLEYIDLVLIHWPGVARERPDSRLHAQMRLETWRCLEEAHGQGKAARWCYNSPRTLICSASVPQRQPSWRLHNAGVSNFELHHIEHLLQHASVPPSVNQIEVHPRFQQKDLLRFCQDQDIQIVAYSSLGCGHLLHDDDVVKACGRAGVEVPVALLRWGVQTGMCVLSKSSDNRRVQMMRPGHVLAKPLPDFLQTELDACDNPTGKFCWDPKHLL